MPVSGPSEGPWSMAPSAEGQYIITSWPYKLRRVHEWIGCGSAHNIIHPPWSASLPKLIPAEDDDILPSQPPSLTDDESCDSEGIDQHRGIKSSHLGHWDENSSVKRANESGVKKSRVYNKKSSSVRPQSNIRLTEGRGDCNGDGDEEGSKDTKYSSSARPRKSPDTRFLACPFYKYNGIRYVSCARLKMKRIRDVKQHLSRRHRQQDIKYCPTCGQVFINTHRRDDHIRARDCQSPPNGFKVEGITDLQSQALARRVDKSLDEPSQWFSIWVIIFPGCPEPSSPYILSYFDEILGMMVGYWQDQGDTLITQAVETRPGFSQYGSDANNRVNNVHAVIFDIFETMFRRFRSLGPVVLDSVVSNQSALESGAHENGSSSVVSAPATDYSTESSPSPGPWQARTQQMRLKADEIMMSRSNSSATSTAVPTECVSAHLDMNQATRISGSSDQFNDTAGLDPTLLSYQGMLDSIDSCQQAADSLFDHMFTTGDEAENLSSTPAFRDLDRYFSRENEFTADDFNWSLPKF